MSQLGQKRAVEATGNPCRHYPRQSDVQRSMRLLSRQAVGLTAYADWIDSKNWLQFVQDPRKYSFAQVRTEAPVILLRPECTGSGRWGPLTPGTIFESRSPLVDKGLQSRLVTPSGPLGANRRVFPSLGPYRVQATPTAFLAFARCSGDSLFDVGAAGRATACPPFLR
jgi:hypothetical protein